MYHNNRSCTQLVPSTFTASSTYLFVTIVIISQPPSIPHRHFTVTGFNLLPPHTNNNHNGRVDSTFFVLRLLSSSSFSADCLCTPPPPLSRQQPNFIFSFSPESQINVTSQREVEYGMTAGFWMDTYLFYGPYMHVCMTPSCSNISVIFIYLFSSYQPL